MNGHFLGAGVGYRRAHRAALLGPEPGPDVLEVMPEHFYAHPDELDALAERYPLVFHCVGLSIGTAVDDLRGDQVTCAQLDRLRGLIRQARPLFLSDHLAFTRSPNGTDLGHLCPLPCNEESFALVAERISVWQDELEVPIALENIAHPFVWPGDTMSEATFFQRLVDETGCGLHLDVTNLLYDARNFGREPQSLLMDHPLESAWALHLAGGVHSSRDRFWNDTHDHPIDDEVFGLLPALRGVAPLRAAIVERDRRLPPLAELLAEARRAAELLREP
jgi:uncharacterized protein (UPF0276 family)